MTDTTNDTDLVQLTSIIVCGYVSHNIVSPVELPRLIAATHAALHQLTNTTEVVVEERPVPAVSVRKSVTPDYLISLEDGRKFKSLKRHLSNRGLTPDDYRQKWGLPKDYPMVAPNYSASRSALAKSTGLGRRAIKVSAKTPRKK